MKPRVLRLLLAVLVVINAVLFADAAEATTIGIGVFSYQEFVGASAEPGTTAFFVDNLTGSFHLPADFPIVDSMIFSDLSLVLTGDVADTFAIPDIGPGNNTMVENGAPPPNLQFPAGTIITSAILSGKVALKSYKYDDGTVVGLFTPDSATFSVTLPLPPEGGVLNALDVASLLSGDFAPIVIDGSVEPSSPTEPSPVPEPATLFLVGAGIVGALRRRSHRTFAR